MGLYSQRSPYTDATQMEVDPNLGRHDDFFLVGPYIFAQRNDSGRVHLYISYLRQPFNLARIPSTDPHQVCVRMHCVDIPLNPCLPPFSLSLCSELLCDPHQ